MVPTHCVMYIWNNGTEGTEQESAFLSLYENSTQLTGPVPVFVNILMRPGSIPSLAESIPELLKRLQIRAQVIWEWTLMRPAVFSRSISQLLDDTVKFALKLPADSLSTYI
jgi:hypothetical protein